MNNLQHNNWEQHVTDLATEAARQLVGTCNSLANLGEEYENAENDEMFAATLDSLVFLCDGCGWWCDIDELQDEGDKWLCEECNDSENENDSY